MATDQKKPEHNFVVLDKEGRIYRIPDELGTKRDYWGILEFIATHGHESEWYGRRAMKLIVDGEVRSEDIQKVAREYWKDLVERRMQVFSETKTEYKPDWLREP